MTAPTAAVGADACPLIRPGGAFTARFAVWVEEA